MTFREPSLKLNEGRNLFPAHFNIFINFRDQSKFCCHMLTHSPSRVGWHKEEGKLIPLFNPVVVVARVSMVIRACFSIIAFFLDKSSTLGVVLICNLYA